MSLRVRLQLEPKPLPLDLAPRSEGPADLNETLPWIPLRRVSSERSTDPQVRCIRCEGRMERGTAPVHIEKEGYRVAWDALPAWVCSRCEAPYFEANEVHLVQRTLSLMKLLSVPRTPAV
jgi:YgiT-type zinc finger domain-containing protein